MKQEEENGKIKIKNILSIVMRDFLIEWLIYSYSLPWVLYNHLGQILSSPLLLLFSHSHVQLFATPWVVANPIATRLLCPWDFSGKTTYWSGLPFPAPGYLPDPGTKATSSALAGDSLSLDPQGSPCLCFK